MHHEQDQPERSRWRSDFAHVRGQRFGREEDFELAEDCAHYLVHEHPHVKRAAAPGNADRKAIQRIFSAHVKRHATGPRRAPINIERTVREQEERLERQARAIDHLLGFVPKRAQKLEEARLEEIVNALRTVAPEEATITVEAEASEETLSAHRIEVHARVNNIGELASLHDIVAERLIEVTEPDEGPSISIEVIPAD